MFLNQKRNSSPDKLTIIVLTTVLGAGCGAIGGWLMWN